MKDKTNKSYLTPTEVADLLMVSPITVRQLAQKGDLRSVTTPGGHRRFLHEDIELFARQRGLSLRKQQEGGLRILVVDDDPHVANYLKELLLSIDVPVNVDISLDGFDAGMKVRSFEPNLVLLDLMMPGMNGFDVCRKLKDDPYTKMIRVVAMTGFRSEENNKKILQAGAEVCLTKPIEVAKLMSILGIHEKHYS